MARIPTVKVLLETKKRSQPADIAKLQYVSRLKSAELRRANSALARLATQLAGVLPFGGRSSLRAASGVGSAGVSENVRSSARQLVAAEEAAAAYKDARERKGQVARLLDVNERQQRELIKAMSSVVSRFRQIARLNTLRLAKAQRLNNPTLIASIVRSSADSRANATEQLNPLRSRLQELKQSEIDLKSQFDQARQDEAALEQAERERQEATSRLTGRMGSPSMVSNQFLNPLNPKRQRRRSSIRSQRTRQRPPSSAPTVPILSGKKRPRKSR